MTSTRQQPTVADAPSPAAGGPDWVVVRDAGSKPSDGRVPRLRTVLIQLSIVAAVVAVAVALVGVAVSRRTAENEAVRQAAELTNVLADSVVQPVLTDAMATSPQAAAALGPTVRNRLLRSGTMVRVKLWTTDGEILYSDEARLVGRRFELDADAREALTDPQVSADVSDLTEPENRYERGMGKLLEVHRPVWTPGGTPLLFEAYYRYDRVDARAGAIWHGFAGITLGSIAVLLLLLVPLGWTLVARARRAQRQREAMMRRTLDASADERRRIAATVHDGVVQDLVAASFAVGSSAQNAAARGESELSEQLERARDAVRGSITGMRTLLVDIYPPNLHEAGLAAAVRDTAASLHVSLDAAIDDRVVDVLDRQQIEAVFRAVQEILRNTAKHAPRAHAALTIAREPASAIVVEISDDGPGFDSAERPVGHLGLSLLEDTAEELGAELALRTAPGAGTSWRLRIGDRS